MRWIGKRVPEPESLLRFRKEQPRRDWDAYDGKEEAWRGLVADQRGLCAYCMCRIRALGPVRIEHFAHQNGSESDTAWSNLLGVCDHGRGKARARQTCDHRKADTALRFDPRRKDHVATVRYAVLGDISTGIPEWDEDIEGTLNLNQELLKAARGRAFQDARLFAKQRLGEGSWSASKVQALLDELRAEPELPEFFGVYEYWLEKKMRIAR